MLVASFVKRYFWSWEKVDIGTVVVVIVVDDDDDPKGRCTCWPN